MRWFALSLASVLCLSAAAPAARAADDPKALAVQARDVFKLYCLRCHHGEGSEGGDFDVLRLATLTEKRGDDKPLIIPGKPDESFLFADKVAKDKMPPKSVTKRPSPAEIDVLKRWIESGAPDVVVATAAVARKYVSQKAVMTNMLDYLRRADKEDVKYLRFFTLTHLYNNPRIPDTDLPIYRAALSKAINSVSWKADIVVPKAIDEKQTIFVVDIRDLDWDRPVSAREPHKNLWWKILEVYPYGMNYTSSSDPVLQKLQDDINERTGCRETMAYIRGDWFVATAMRPPLYHTLLRLPNNVYDLEMRLGVNVQENFENNKLQRAGFIASGVSEQNRLVERHTSLYGSYWKSYDFKKDRERGELVRFPLGPVFPKNKYHNQAFVQDGGEMIFHLPNHLMGYFLVDGKDKRINVGPIEVVSDSNKTSGTNEIVTGVSCMVCHKHGVFPLPKDQIRDGQAIFGEAKRKVERLFPKPEDMKKYERMDSDRFVEALDRATAPFLKVGPYTDKAIREFDEPIGEINKMYRLVNLDLAMVAYELDVEKPAALLTKLGEKRLKALQLGPLMREGGVLKRAEWERVGATSQFQRVAHELELGTPLNLQK